MDLFMTMFKPKQSMSPAKSLDTSSHNHGATTTTITPTHSKKRKHDPSPTRLVNGGGDSSSQGSARGVKSQKTANYKHDSKHGSNSNKRQGFTFEEVKSIIDNLLAQDKKKLDSSINVALKNIDFSGSIVAFGHKAEEYKELIDKLVHNTRRIRTLEEVLQDIRSNLNKRTYTDIILQTSLGEPPKRPPSAYLLYHQERFKELQEEGETLAAEIAKRVSEEWKNMDDQARAKYMKQHDREVKAYEESIERMGLGKTKKPVRPMSAKLMFVRAKMGEREGKLPKDKAKLAKLKQQLEADFENAEPDIKEFWISMYNAEHSRYVEEKIKFVEDNPHLDPNDIIKTRVTRAKIKPPAAARNALRMYMLKKLPEGLEGQELKDTEAKLREKFERMSTKKQLKYIKKALRDKERYETELEEFMRENPDYKVPKHKPNITHEQWRLYQSQVEHKPQNPAPTAYLHFCSNKIKSLDDPESAPTARLRDASEAWKKLGHAGQNKVHKEHLEYINQYIGEMEAWLEEQDEKRIEQLVREDPKSMPDYWRKRILRLEKCNVKKENHEAAKISQKRSALPAKNAKDYSETSDEAD